MLSITSNCHVGLRARKLSRTQRVPYKLSIRKETEYCPKKSVYRLRLVQLKGAID